MPYTPNQDLPPSVRDHLPAHAQDIFRSAFNSAWRTYGRTNPAHIEEIAHRVGWAAVKRAIADRATLGCHAKAPTIDRYQSRAARADVF